MVVGKRGRVGSLGLRWRRANGWRILTVESGNVRRRSEATGASWIRHSAVVHDVTPAFWRDVHLDYVVWRAANRRLQHRCSDDGWKEARLNIIDVLVDDELQEAPKILAPLHRVSYFLRLMLVLALR